MRGGVLVQQTTFGSALVVGRDSAPDCRCSAALSGQLMAPLSKDGTGSTNISNVFASTHLHGVGHRLHQAVGVVVCTTAGQGVPTRALTAKHQLRTPFPPGCAPRTAERTAASQPTFVLDTE
jgi:hypothetical protein